MKGAAILRKTVTAGLAPLLAATVAIGLSLEARAETGSAEPAAAAAPPALTFGGDMHSRSKLTGDWGGLRDDWAAHGFTADFDTIYTVQGVAAGGIPNAGTTPGNTTLSILALGLDTTKAQLWPGGLFSLRLEGRGGDSVLGRAGTVSPVNTNALTPNSPGNLNKNVFGLTELTYTQFFSPSFGIFGGLLNTYAGDDNPIAGNPRSNASFLNLSFLMSLVEAGSVPNVALGGGGVFIPSPNIIGKLTIMNSQESATINPFENSSGTTFATDWTIKHKLFDEPGQQLFGFLYGIGKSRAAIAADPRVFVANLVVNQAIPNTTASTWAFYYNAAQYIQGDEQHGWGPFLRFGVSDGDPNPVKWNIAVGIGGKGLFPGRDNDHWGAGFYYLDISNTALLTRLKVNDEVGGEMFYNFALTPAMHTTFDLQVVSSARPRQETAVILGGRVGLNF